MTSASEKPSRQASFFESTSIAARSTGSRSFARRISSISVFEAYPYTVVSLDFIKSERRLDDFLRACPEMVVVDEAHAAVSGGRARHRRFALLRQLADDQTRHLLLLTA